MTSCAGIPDGDPRPSRSGRGRRWGTEPLTPAQQDLAARWVGLAKSEARRWSRDRQHLHDDFASAAMHALCVAARSFDESRNLSFYTHVKWHLRDARGGVLAELVPKGYRITGAMVGNPWSISLRKSRPKLVAMDPEKGWEATSTIDRDVASERETHERDRARLAMHLASLSDRHRSVVERVILQGETLEAVAGSLGKPKAQIVRILTTALRALGLRKLPGGRLVPLED